MSKKRNRQKTRPPFKLNPLTDAVRLMLRVQRRPDLPHLLETILRSREGW